VAVDNLTARLRWEREVARDLSLSLSLALARGAPSAAERLGTSSTVPGWIVRLMSSQAVDAVAEARWQLGQRGSLVVGSDLTVDRERLLAYANTDATGVVTPVQGIDPGEKTFTNAGLYAQTLLHPLALLAPAHEAELGLTAGARLDHHSQYGSVLDWRLGLTWQAREWLGLKALYGTSFKAPSPAQLYANRMQPLGVESNPNLVPERARTAELGVTVRIGPHLAVSANGYYLHILDKVQLILPSGPVATVRPENLSEVKSLGAEGEVVLQYGESSAFVNASLQAASELRLDPIRGHVWVTSTLYPAQMFKAGLTQRVPAWHLSVYLEGRWTGRRLASDPNAFLSDALDYRTEPYALPGYAVADLALGSDRLLLFGDHETDLRLRVTDLADAGGTYPGFRDADIPGLGRTYSFSIRQRF
jgi:outer membrane receptor protein involved in Fe transport